MSQVSGSSLGGYRTAPPSRLVVPAHEDVNSSKAISRTHYNELSAYLAGKEPPASRSNARDKLTRLTRVQFQELSTDVYDELVRRKKEDQLSNDVEQEPFLASNPDFHPKRNQARQKLATLPTSRFKDLASDVLFELERRYPEFKEDPYPPPTSFSSWAPQRSMSPQQKQQPKQYNMTQAAQEVLVPNKSTLVEEEINQPGPPNGTYRPFSPPYNNNNNNNTSYDNLGSPLMSPTSVKQHSVQGSDTSSVAARQVINGYANSVPVPQSLPQDRDLINSLREELQSIKGRHDQQLSTLQSRLAGLERDLSDSQREHKATQSRSQDIQAELKDIQEHAEQQQELLEARSQEIANLKQAQLAASSSASAARDREAGELRSEVQEAQAVAEDLRGEIKALIDELQSTNAQLESCLAERERLETRLEESEKEVEEWRQQYQQAKTELRNVSASSQLYAPNQSTAFQDDFMPPSEDGAIQSQHATDFQAAINGLLSAARSHTPSSVLKATNAIVLSVTKIDEDVQAYELSSFYSRLDDQGRDELNLLKPKCHATLSNVVTAAKNHASASGFSPVSLVDAASSHLSVTIVEMIKLLKIRKGPLPNTPSNPMNTSFSNSSLNGGFNGSFNSSLGQGKALPSLDELRANGSSSRSSRDPSPSALSHSQRTQGYSATSYTTPPTSSYTMSSVYNNSPPLAAARNAPTQPLRQASDSLRQDAQEPLAVSAVRSQPLVQQPASEASDRSSNYDSGFQPENSAPHESEVPLTEEEWYRFKDFLSNATTEIVRDIQKLLASLRSRDEHSIDQLHQIISTVTEIISSSREHLPYVDSQQWDLQCLETLQMESERLRELQSRSTGKSLVFDKAANSQVTNSTYQIVKAMKALNVMFEDREEEDELT